MNQCKLISETSSGGSKRINDVLKASEGNTLAAKIGNENRCVGM